MRCPYCSTENDESVEYCRKCGEEIAHGRSQWQGPDGQPDTYTPQRVSTANDEWDPAKRYSGARPTSAYVPPPRYPTHVSWIITVVLLGIPATGIHAILFWRGVEYPHNLDIAVWVLLACSLPLSLLALASSGMVRAMHHVGKDGTAYRFSQATGLFCWIALVAALALYVILFLRLMYNVGEFWVP